MAAVKIDKEVLAATVVALDDLAATLPDLVARAGALDARGEMAGLTEAPDWARHTATDLRARIGVLEQIEQSHPTFGGVAMTADQARAIAGQSLSVEEALLATTVVAPAADAWAETDPANLQEWFEQMQAEALRRLADLDDAEVAETLVDVFNGVRNIVGASEATVASVTALVVKGGPALASWLARREIIAPGLTRIATASPWLANVLAGGLKTADDYYLRTRTQFTYPGSFVPNATQGMLLRTAGIVEDFDGWVARMAGAVTPYGDPKPTLLARMLQSEQGVQATGWVSNLLKNPATGQALQRAATWGNNVFGRPWTNPVTTTVYGRGASNLLTVARTSGLGTAAATAGGLRLLGAAGSAAMTVDNLVGLYRNKEENAALWAEGGTEGKAHVVGEYAEFAFNASMTAALIAPNPVTLGLVAVTGVVWAGAEVVEHWDDISAAAGQAADWAGDRAEDASEWVGDQVDAVKESSLNPMNWF
ncbi:hypothetical protein [Cellulomonas sp. SLBN-39]|uniref:hypothetical protein n=1 Tax=Cellulomonas sp. SLBN-39 TaxID=2768446 RepID=UPI00114ECABA|nr:hypothetical protein [Cellulomonas sp. SLBN-39]TQL01845.1 hypothetical protein FBY24_0905 [Cellulomonas sp. SLBN-39]